MNAQQKKRQEKLATDIEVQIQELTVAIQKLQTAEYADHCPKKMLAKLRLALSSLQEKSVAIALVLEEGWKGEPKPIFEEPIAAVCAAKPALKQASTIIADADAEKVED